MKKLFFTLIALVLANFAIAQCNTTFQASTSGNQVTVTNTTTWTLIPGSTPTCWLVWGDGNSNGIGYATNSTASHTYANPGTYAITMWTQYFDTLNNTLYCMDSVFQTVTITTPCMSSISTLNNGGGSYSFTANNIGGGTGISYTWNFGDGSTGTGSSVNHTYTASGNYVVTLTSTGSGCTYTSTAVVNYFNGTINCSALSAQFTHYNSGMTVGFTNLSTPSGVSNVTNSSTWDFGDGSNPATGGYYVTHTYAAPGTYTVKLINHWVDSNNQSIVYCTDSTTQQITVTAPPPQPNVISGYVFWDSTLVNLQTMTFKLWLIVMDSAQNTLTAVDSAVITGGGNIAAYAFQNKAAGSYRVKAAVVSGTTGASSFVPTYAPSTAYWSSANVIIHTGGTSSNNNIQMITGTWTGGPGFVGGNISQGANKGTTGGVAGMLVMLRNAQNDVIRFTYTDGNGDYSFGNIAAGTYNVYPEAINYSTIPSAALNVASGPYNISGVDFTQNATQIHPGTTSVQTASKDMFRLYPNPSHGLVTINWSSDVSGKANIQVADITGRIVFTTEAATSSVTKLDLSALGSGVYFIKIATDKAQHSEKLMIGH